MFRRSHGTLQPTKTETLAPVDWYACGENIQRFPDPSGYSDDEIPHLMQDLGASFDG